MRWIVCKVERDLNFYFSFRIGRSEHKNFIRILNHVNQWTWVLRALYYDGSLPADVEWKWQEKFDWIELLRFLLTFWSGIGTGKKWNWWKWRGGQRVRYSSFHSEEVDTDFEELAEWEKRKKYVLCELSREFFGRLMTKINEKREVSNEQKEWEKEEKSKLQKPSFGPEWLSRVSKRPNFRL